MKVSSPFVLPLLFATITVARPQASLNNLPVCAQNAVLTSVQSTGCSLLDVQCICKSTPFLNTLRSYIVQNCGAADTDAALAFGQSICTSTGAPFPVTGSGLYATPGFGGPTVTTTIPPTTMTSTTTLAGAPLMTSTVDANAAAPGVNGQMMNWTATGVNPTMYTGGAVAGGGLATRQGGIFVLVALAGIAGIAVLL